MHHQRPRGVPVQPLEVHAGRVDVWRIVLDVPPKVDPASVLSADECARVQRFHFERDRGRFARCRFALREILSWYLGISPAEIRFEYQSKGKPEVSQNQNPRRISFSVSHSGDLALIAVGGDNRLGVDIEQIRGDIDAAALAERFFSDRERAILKAAPDDVLLPLFFACWTCKEALLKGTGFGLSFRLSDFTVAPRLAYDSQIVEIADGSGSCRQWTVMNIPVDDGYRAALAVESESATLSICAYSDSTQ